MTKGSTEKNTDGRRLRSERSRQAIIDAALDIVREGHLAPTAQMVSDRAGVGIRSFFRHFPDMESLIVALDEELQPEAERFGGGDRDGSTQERIQHAVERHADAYEAVSNLFLYTTSNSWRYEALTKNYARAQRRIRRDLDDWLPELTTMSASEREAVDAVASFEMWHRLRQHQGLSKNKAIEVLVELLEKLILG